MQQPVPERHSYRYWGNAVCARPTDAHFGITTIGWWGMTETITHGIVGQVGQPNASMSLGRPAPDYAIHVLDEAGQPVQSGETGEMFVGGQRGVSLFLEYAGDPEATAAAVHEDGLFATGDRVRLGEDGFLYFADRAKEMLKVGGENVAASEIEAAISRVPGVAEVAAPPYRMLCSMKCPQRLLFLPPTRRTTLPRLFMRPARNRLPTSSGRVSFVLSTVSRAPRSQK